MKSYLSTGSEEKTPQASVTHHAASSHTSQSQSADMTDNDEEPIGDRWDEDEDWGSLEVGSPFHQRKIRIPTYIHI